MFGTIKYANTNHGYAFIRARGEDYFFPAANFDGCFDLLRRGDKVTFDVGEPTSKGQRAVNVRRAEETTNDAGPVRFGDCVPDAGHNGE